MRAAGSARDSLVLFADSAAWASITRFKVPELHAALLPEHPSLRRIRVTVETGTPARARRPARDPPVLSPAAAGILRAAARSMDHPRLARVLVRLAARASPAPGGGTGVRADGPPRAGLNPPSPDGHR